MSRARCDCISRTAKDLVDVLVLQETHAEDDSNASKLRIYGFKLITAVHHAKYGIPT